ncbi:acyl-CoA dehydrogenase family protein [Microbacterium sp. ASV49]|uniref:Acyl-CoA dehydrogenase family protein n=1 Tax=Microbacterium candidum TaxID=3041922 RepID=A0ABT7MY03_9MICO|nr:acyl-CoA dehydrogenase family protein [Microbacterium sp. ASV49]MDL9979316.1 acyl-CoA dehydrogenase family protein [Microbacterium sp. ASV49]
MQFDLSEEQQELVSMMRALLQQRSGSTAVRAAMTSDSGYDAELWRVLCEEIGAASLAIPEEYGGAGFTSAETHLVLEELGYALTPSPFFGSAVLAAQALLLSGDADACERLLPGIADGSQIAALAWADAAGNWAPGSVDVTATRAGDAWALDGETPLVLFGGIADVVVAIARTDVGPALFEVTDVDAVERIATPALDPTQRFATLGFAGVPAKMLAAGSDARLDVLRDRALTAITALQVGAAARGLDMTVAYAGQRVQFGRTIGSFQALKHRMADMHVELETARTASRAAAWAAAHDAPELVELAPLAKARCSDALNRIAGETIQLHGGIAITWEHDAHLVFKRAHATAQLLGDADAQRRRIQSSLGL